MRDYILDFCKRANAKVSLDSANNIHAIKGKPKVCLQAHYDMVCIADAPKLDIYEKDGFLRARNSSLGSDNGIGICIMLEALLNFEHIECLFTSDEEVGLLGANALEHKIISSKFLNLDHEIDNEVVTSCAGGVDILADLDISYKNESGYIYELSAIGLKGGHSGVDIVSNPTSSIKILARFIAKNNGQIIGFNAGERINSIPKHGIAKVLFAHKIKDSNSNIEISFIKEGQASVIAQSERILDILNGFAQGLRVYDDILGIARTSINLATAKSSEDKFIIQLFARSNDLRELKELDFDTHAYFRSAGFNISSSNFYAPWENAGKDASFALEVLDVMKRKIKDARLFAIHAGLECGAIKARQAHINPCSIGPNIFNPHSTDERVEVDSINKITSVVFDVLEQNQK